jgi:PTH1 family peptidyl-tRNA hydrolase
MKLLVGLGNPGRKYLGTRHNVGFATLARLADRHAQSRTRRQFDGDTIEANIGGQRALLLLPQTYMNRSGQSVQQALRFYKLELVDLLVVCDDINLPLGKLRLRPKGSAGGQKGIQDVIRALGSDQFARLRIGIGSPPQQWDASDFVLSKFTPDEQETVNQAIDRAAQAAVDWVGQGIQYCMNRYNAGSVAPSAADEPSRQDRENSLE